MNLEDIFKMAENEVSVNHFLHQTGFDLSKAGRFLRTDTFSASPGGMIVKGMEFKFYSPVFIPLTVIPLTNCPPISSGHLAHSVSVQLQIERQARVNAVRIVETRKPAPFLHHFLHNATGEVVLGQRLFVSVELPGQFFEERFPHR